MKNVTENFNYPSASSFRICTQKAQNYSACVQQSIEAIRPFLKTGDFGSGFKLKNGIDPISIDDFTVDKQGIYAVITNLVAYGASNFVFDRFKIDLEKAKMDVIITIPRVEALGNYKINLGRSLLNVRSNGRIKNTLSNLKVRIQMKGRVESRNDDKYVKMESCNVAVKVNSIKLYMENLFKDEKALNDVANQIINQNTELFVPELEESLRKSLCEFTNLN